MNSYRFRLVNVFTRGSDRLSGNPLCVVENGERLDARTMQAIALQFNLSETTFILPSTRADARVRIFTPNYEMPFAGHPTLGTAHVCRALGIDSRPLRLETQAGIIDVEPDGDRWTLTAPFPTWREAEPARQDLAAALGIDTGDIGERPVWVKAGTEQLVVPLNSPEAVRRAAPVPLRCAGLTNDQGVVMIYVFAPTDGDRVLARFFFSQGPAMLEDPATGSATANFGGWFLAMGHPLPIRRDIEQGEMVGRPSSLRLEVGAQTRGEARIRVTGAVIEVGSGSLDLD